MGLSAMSIAEPERRDRLLLVCALALLTLLGAAGERLGMERYLKANTANRPPGLREHRPVLAFTRKRKSGPGRQAGSSFKKASNAAFTSAARSC
jgi:hypothetical protein